MFLCFLKANMNKNVQYSGKLLIVRCVGRVAPVYFNKWLPITKLLIHSFDKAVLLLYLPMKCRPCILITWFLFLSLSSKLYIFLRITCFFASMSFVRYIFISCKSLSFYLIVIFNWLSFGFILNHWYTNIFHHFKSPKN